VQSCNTYVINIFHVDSWYPAIIECSLFVFLQNGIIKVFLIESWSEIFSVQCPEKAHIKSITADIYGIFVIVIDKFGAGSLLDLVNIFYTPI